ncbi:MAG TPA: hypothetical protein VFI61_03065 [Patescibacteria group bacterium]|nr:hypothetical protein [Patescibacteria group bacterium]
MATPERELADLREKAIFDFTSNAFAGNGIRATPEEVKEYIKILKNSDKEADKDLSGKFMIVWMYIQHKAGLLMYSRLEKNKK